MLQEGQTVKIIDPNMVQFTEGCPENKKERFYRNYEKNKWVIHFMNPGEQEPCGLVLVNEEGLYASVMSNFIKPLIKVYLSGPITGYKNGNKELFESYENKLIALDFEVVNPHKLGIDEKHTHQQAMRIDLVELLKCDCIAMMPDLDATDEPKWFKSKGCKVEATVAISVGMHIINAETGSDVSEEFFMMLHPHRS